MLVVESVVATSSRALSAIAQPRIREVASQATRTTLTLGDTVLFPDQSLTIHIDIKKAVSSAGVKSMKQMSLRGFEKSSAIQASQSQANDPPPPTSASFGGFSNMGRTFDMTLADAGLTVGNTVLDQAAEHGVTRETLFFYRPSALTAAEAEKKKKNDEEREKAAGEEVSDAREEGEEGGDDEEEEPEEEEDESLKPVNAERLTQAHYYGGTLVDTGDMEEGTGQLPGKQTGMQIIGFQRMDQVSSVFPRERHRSTPLTTTVTDSLRMATQRPTLRLRCSWTHWLSINTLSFRQCASRETIGRHRSLHCQRDELERRLSNP